MAELEPTTEPDQYDISWYCQTPRADGTSAGTNWTSGTVRRTAGVDGLDVSIPDEIRKEHDEHCTAEGDHEIWHSYGLVNASRLFTDSFP